MHLGSRNLNVEPPFSAVGRTLPELFCISDKKSCMWAHVFACRELGGRHAGFAVRDAEKLSEMQSFRISGRKTCMSAHHFHRLAAVFASRVAKPECRTTIFTSRPYRLLFCYFTISCPFGSRQRFLHLGSRNLNVEPPFSPVGRTVYYFTILRLHVHSVPGRSFCISGRET